MRKNWLVSPKIRNKKRMCPTSTPVQYSTGTISQSSQARGRNTGDRCRKGRNHAFLTDDVTLYIEGPQISRSLPERMNRLSKIAGHKINVQKSIAFQGWEEGPRKFTRLLHLGKAGFVVCFCCCFRFPSQTPMAKTMPFVEFGGKEKRYISHCFPHWRGCQYSELATEMPQCRR